MDERHPMNG
ncbi:hypothetical protein FWK35_00019545 [Aphis craccivora]|uniref:Uncharacterized protein n=1 Tax=Aphis craccivora TaxID=307492 RepID=A0A6G0X021_APHCR|nr:hypothetical protein FWK35_00019545 [Aphis craccivora]